VGSIAVIDYGMGNLFSIVKALEHVAVNDSIVLTSDADDLERASHIVLPGVGAIRECMAELKRLDLVKPIRELAPRKPFLGICLGLQAVLGFSDENDGVEALNLIKGRVRLFDQALQDEAGEPIRIPHIGWNQIYPTISHPLWNGINPGAYFYFVHSYYAPDNVEGRAASTVYGLDFSSALTKGTIFAVQFHPEKSHTTGLKFLSNFVHWNPVPQSS